MNSLADMSFSLAVCIFYRLKSTAGGFDPSSIRSWIYAKPLYSFCNTETYDKESCCFYISTGPLSDGNHDGSTIKGVFPGLNFSIGLLHGPLHQRCTLSVFILFLDHGVAHAT